jgi:pyruvate,water dikinase
VFARAGGVVIEMGSLLSHGSTLAREYGIPVVINVAGITRLVREADWLVVDGNLGKVAIERSAAPVQ